MSSTHRRTVLTLYSRILHAHRARLPDHLRQLGDSYVREEFKRHKKADAKFIVSFMAEWSNYLSQLEKQSVASGSIGANLDPQVAGMLTDEQKAKLSELKVAADKIIG